MNTTTIVIDGGYFTVINFVLMFYWAWLSIKEYRTNKRTLAALKEMQVVLRDLREAHEQLGNPPTVPNFETTKRKVLDFMSKFLDDLHAEISKIVTTNPGADADAIAKAVTDKLQPEIDTLTSRVSDLETGVSDAVKHLANDDTAAATTALQGVAPAQADAGAAS